MTSRDMFTLSLRLFSFWVMFSAISSMANLVAIVSMSEPSMQRYLASAGFSVLAYSSLAALLLLFAPQVSRLLTKPSEAGTGPVAQRSLVPRDYYLIAARVLGVYSLFQAVVPFATLVRQLLSTSSAPIELVRSIEWSALVQTVVYLAAAGILIYGAPTIANIFERDHRAPVRENSSSSAS